MDKRFSRSWSFITVLTLLGVISSMCLVIPTAARPIADEGTPPVIAPERPSQGRQRITPAMSATKQTGFISYQEPGEVVLRSLARSKLGAAASEREIEATARTLLAEWRRVNPHGPDPDANERLRQNEQRALAAGTSPEALGLAVTGTLRLFTVAVEFDGTDTAEDFSHPRTVFDDRTCITETVTFEGPLHNQIPQPGPRDNQTPWVADFNTKYYEDLVLSKTGLTTRLRPDLIDPEDGQPGIDVSGQSMRNYYEEISGGQVQFDTGPAGVIAWLQVPHSEAYYGATACTDDDPGRYQDMDGLPQNPRFGNGPAQLLVDIVDEINASRPDFPWADYDTDGNGVIDHVVIFHAGKDKSDGGGLQSYGALWAHRGNVDPGDGGYLVDDGGTTTPDDDIRLAGYTMQYEDVQTGVLVHEFGHDLGLPDLYDTSGEGESSPVWWDLMSTGSHTGKLFSTHPTNMSAWSKFALGWSDTQIVTPTADMMEIDLGQTTAPPAGTEQAVQVNLPSTVVTNTELLDGSTQAWWSNNDQNWADVRLSRELDLTAATGPISMSFDIDYVIEEDWDYLFVEVLPQGSTTYTQTKGFEVGSNTELTTPDDYEDPNGRLGDYGDLVHGYTGDSEGWVRVYHDLSPWAGQRITVRFRYATDAAFLERGAFVDNISVTAGEDVLLEDPVEDGNMNGWTTEIERFTQEDPLGDGWVLSNGTQLLPMYYLLEWRNPVGFDRGLLYTYNSIFTEIEEDGTEEWVVDKVPSNVPGMLVWLRDTRFGGEPFGADNSILNPDNQFVAMPSEGPKGGLLVVDSHPEPLREPVNYTITNDYGTFVLPEFSNWSGRVQTTNAAFTLDPTPAITLTVGSGTALSSTTILTPTRYTAMEAVPGFHDALGYFPGVEKLPQPITTFFSSTTRRFKPYAFKDPDASVVVPAKSYYPPKTPAGFTGRGSEKSPPSPSVSTFETVYYLQNSGILYPVSIGEAGGVDVVGQYSGNPGSSNVQYGYHFEVVDQTSSGSIGTVRLWNAMRAVSVRDSIRAGNRLNQPVTVRINAQNVGSPMPMTIYSDFDETKATYVEGSATNGAVPVRASEADVRSAFQRGGIAAVRALQVAPGEATAVVWTSPTVLDTGARASFTYQLTRKAGQLTVRVVNRVFGPSLAQEASVVQLGTTTYMPLVFGGE